MNGSGHVLRMRPKKLGRVGNFVDRIEISGGIACGKTTLAGVLKAAGFAVVFEDFSANPFWKPFYTNPKEYAFETEITFLLQHFHDIKAANPSGMSVVCDYSFALDRAYVDVTLSGAEKNAFLAVFEQVQTELPPPVLLVQLDCPAEEELRRVRVRARAVEASITYKYLEMLSERVVEHVGAWRAQGVPVLRIDSRANNFATDRATQAEMVELVRKAL
jgi:deoxyadenosine/deoxycytidine kinase